MLWLVESIHLNHVECGEKARLRYSGPLQL
jgi:hypothetical protein